MNNIRKTVLHPVGDDITDLYPKTSADQIEGLSEAILALIPESTKGIKSMVAGLPEVVGELTNTPIIVTFTDNTTTTLIVSATNGAKGENGISIDAITEGASYVAGDETITPISVTLTEGEPQEFSVKAKNGTNGTDGTDGNGIVSIHTIGHTIEGDETVTTVEVAYDEGEPQQFEVHAQNGSGSGEKYTHTVTISGTSEMGKDFSVTVSIVSDSSSPITKESLLSDYSNLKIIATGYFGLVSSQGSWAIASKLDIGTSTTFATMYGYNVNGNTQRSASFYISDDDVVVTDEVT